jgi:hypothetical protein
VTEVTEEQEGAMNWIEKAADEATRRILDETKQVCGDDLQWPGTVTIYHASLNAIRAHAPKEELLPYAQHRADMETTCAAVKYSSASGVWDESRCDCGLREKLQELGQEEKE